MPEHHAGLAALSSRGEHLTAETTNHYVHYGQPQLVLDSVRRVLDAVGS